MSTSPAVPTQPTPPPEFTLLQMITGGRLSQMIYVAARLEIADLLKEGPQGPDELASRTDSHPESLYRLLRGLASLGIFSEDGQGRFGLTPLAELLCSDAPTSMRAMALMFGDPWMWRSWGRLLDAVRSGTYAALIEHCQESFDFLEQHPDDAATFDQAMTSLSAAFNPAVVQDYDWSGIGTLVDVGGGHGTLLAAILKAQPGVRGILFDQPATVVAAQQRFAAEGLADRCTFAGGSFFEAVPEGGDTYVLKNVIHDWDDERALRILRNCQRAMRPGSRLLVIEMVIEPGNEPYLGKLLDIVMLVVGGKARSAAEFRTLLGAAGFDLRRIVKTRSPVRVVEAVRQ